MSMDPDDIAFEEIISATGGFGRWHLLFLLFTASSCVIAATHHVVIIFLAATPKFACADGLDELNVTFDNACFADGPNGTEPCRTFVFDQSEYSSTLVSQWTLVCNRVYLLPVIQGSYFGGVILGCLLSGLVSDTFGRRPTVLGLAAIHIVASYSAAFADHYGLFIFLRLFIGGTAHTCWGVITVIAMELVERKYRIVVMTAYQIGWKVGFMILALFGYLIRDWFWLQLGISFINISMLFYIWIIPESPRWLIHQGRSDDAKNVMTNIATINNIKTDDNFDTMWSKYVQQMNKHTLPTETTFSQRVLSMFGRVKTVFTTELRTRFLLLIYPWFMVGMAYYGIFLSVKLVSVSKHLLTVILGFIEIPCTLVGIIAYNKLGRIHTILSMFLLGGIMSLSIYFTPSTSDWSRPVLIIIGKCCSAVLFQGIDLITPELFPTFLRNETFLLLDACSKLGSAVAPFIVDLLSLVDLGLPNLVIGAFMILAFAPLVFLPETKKSNIPETLEDALHKHGPVLASKCCKM